MKHEIIISSEDFEDYKRLKKLEQEEGAIITTLSISMYGFTRYESIYMNNEERKTWLYTLLERTTHNDELALMSWKDFKKFKKQLN